MLNENEPTVLQSNSLCKIKIMVLYTCRQHQTWLPDQKESKICMKKANTIKY